LPVEPLESRCDRIIGVNVTPIHPQEELGSMLAVGYRTFDLVMWANVSPRLPMCDLVISPDASRFGLFELWKADEIYELGYQATKARLAEIEALARGARPAGAFRTRRQVALPDQGFWARLWARLRRWWQRLWRKGPA
ncbi:MAG: hypothetical protein D6722_02170, partial [Bacteroidetes bacterium]